MERIKKLKAKAEKRKETNEVEIARLEEAERVKGVEIESERVAERKRQADIDHKSYLREQQRQQDQKNFDNSNEGRKQRNFREAKKSEARDIKMGLTREQRGYKNMDVKERRRCDNAIKQGDAKDVIDFQRQQRLQREASERNRRRLKGL